VKRTQKRFWVAATVLGALTSACAAEMATLRLGTAPKAGPTRQARVRRAQPPVAYVPKAPTAPRVDGELTEAVWKRATQLHLARTLDGSGRAAQPTEVLLLRHGKTLYVGVRAFEPLLKKLQATRRGHDGGIWEDDSIEIFLGVGGAYYHFGINAVGSTYDARAKDKQWDCGFKAAAGRGDSRWTLEIAIPLDKMVKGAKIPQEWTANVNRNRHVTGSMQESSWSPTYSGDSHVPTRFGRLLLKAPPKSEPAKPPEKPLVRTPSVTVIPVRNGLGVARFDLAALPRGARIYRADLLIFRTARVDGRMDEARVDIEIYPLFGKVRAGAEVRPTTKPVALRPPWYDRFDVTEAVRAWVSGKPNGGFFVKACPFWDAQATCLDIAYEGRAEKVPPQVTGVKAFHRAGQTFITWREISDPVGRDKITWGALKAIMDGVDRTGRLRYCVYRHSERITAANLHQAELIAQVKPLSGWNVNGRNIDRPVDDYIATADGIMTGHWNPFGRARLDGQFGRDCVIDRLVIRDGQPPLPRATGLYVHTPGKEGSAYYAVVTSLDGVQNTRDISDANSLVRPVAETRGEGEPVLQRELPKMPFFNYDQKRLHYVRWVAPPYVNVPSEYYNWSVGVPSQLGEAVPLELNLHRDGHSYWRTHYRIERDSIVLSPHDFPINTWWYGYHEAYGTLRSFNQGRIHPYTERRLLAFIEWACRKWPVDRNRILVTGCRGGASGAGALHLGLRHPEVFNLVISGHGAIDYAAEAVRTDRRGLAAAQSMQAIWGRPEWNIPTESGGSFWEGHDMPRLVRNTSPRQELPFVTLTYSGEGAHRFYRAMLETRRGVMGQWAWGGARYLPVSASGTYPNVIRLDLRKNAPYLAIAHASGLEERETKRRRSLNTHFRWRDVVDKADRFEATISGTGQGYILVPRRCRNFKPAPGKVYAWTNTLLPGAPKPTRPRPGTLEAGPQSGQARVGDNGLLEIRGVALSPAGSRLVVTVKQ